MSRNIPVSLRKEIESQFSDEVDLCFLTISHLLLIDPISARYLAGAEVDFVDNITGGGFTIKNPNAKSTCGCGSSFSV